MPSTVLSNKNFLSHLICGLVFHVYCLFLMSCSQVFLSRLAVMSCFHTEIFVFVICICLLSDILGDFVCFLSFQHVPPSGMCLPSPSSLLSLPSSALKSVFHILVPQTDQWISCLVLNIHKINTCTWFSMPSRPVQRLLCYHFWFSLFLLLQLI